MNWFFGEADGSYFLTTVGIVAVSLLIVVIFALAAVLLYKTGHTAIFTTKQSVIIAVMLALAVITSNIKIYHMPNGGSVTVFSMLFICLIGYWYGAKIGFLAAFIYSILQFLLGGSTYMLSFLQVCLDYILAFAALGLTGFFRDRKYGLVIGYIVSILARGAISSLAGYLYWMDTVPESFPESFTIFYPIIYNYSYILAEGILTVVLLSIPAVREAMAQTRKMIQAF